MLALIMVFGLTSTVLATGDGVLDISVVNEDIHAKMNAVKVGDVTRYTGYIEFPKGSTQDLSKVEIEAEITGAYNLKVDGVDYEDGMSVDFSKGYVDFTLNKKNGKEFRTYQVNAGIEGKHVQLIVSFNLDNAKAWVNGSYKSNNKEGYEVPKASANENAKKRVEDALLGFGKTEIIPVSAEIGKSAMDAFNNAIAGKGYNIVGTGYISEIGKDGNPTLPDRLFQRTEPSKFPEGDYMADRTGWIYLMNEKVANMGATQYIITASDKSITWGYTFDWGIDLGGPEW